MLKRGFIFALGLLLVATLSLLAASCSKKVVQEEGLTTTPETRPSERPSQLGAGVGRPTEESLSPEERQRREAEAAFVNQDVISTQERDPRNDNIVTLFTSY